jgi:Zn-dependent protease with chaperone function
MPVKVKRGLGLLVVAAIGYLFVNAAQESGGGGTAASAFEAVGWLLAAVGLVGGLLLLAWGLLRD